MKKGFESIPFHDPGHAEQRLSALADPAAPAILDHLARALAECADPDATLVRVERFVEASPDSAVEQARMAGSLRYVRMMCRVFDQSHFVTDIICREPDLMRWLAEDVALDHARDRDEMINEICTRVAECSDAAACARAMRLFRQREVARITTREVFTFTSLASLTEDISNLADAAMEAAIRFTWRNLAARFGEPRSQHLPEEKRPDLPVSFVIIGMGKLGGRELNFSSDIDLLFLYSDDGETTGGREGSLTASEFFQKLGEQVIRLMSEVTPDGMIFRVDMRLRPYGRMSPLAITAERAIEYYGHFAQAWERQSLIKARPAAGDIGLGASFIERTRPMVFPRYFDDETLEAIREIKGQMEAQIEERGETEIDVKLGRGGIRDVEFTVQILQMLNGGRMPEFRTNNTLAAIRALGMRGLLTAFDADTLASNYTFMRRVEHRLQIDGGQQRHVLPTDSGELELLARRLGYSNAASFLTDYRDRAQATRGILNRFMATEGSGHLWTYDLLSMHTDGAIGIRHLVEDYAFQDGARAREELRLLSAGPVRRPYPFHIRQAFAAIVPTMLVSLADTGDPDDTLIRLSRILTNLQAPASVYNILKDAPELTRHLVALVANSQYLSEILVRDPGLFDLLANPSALRQATPRQELEETLDALLHAYDAEAAPYRLHQGETLRIGLRELLCGATVPEVGRELAQLAEVVLACQLAAAREAVARRFAEARGAFAILALGKLGGAEMGYGSDLDLVFVYHADAEVDSEHMAPSEYFAAVAAHTIRRLKEPTRYGMLYDVDARLRPDGNKGVLAVNHRRIEDYYLSEAQAWERLALTKVRVVAGDLEFGRQVEERLREIAFSLSLNADALFQIEDLRAKLARNVGAFELKKHEGGIAEIEFAVRLLQIRHAADVPQLRCGNVLEALDALEQGAFLETDDAAFLRDAYLLFRRIENRARMMHGRSEGALPNESAGQSRLAHRLGIDHNIAERVAAVQEHVHGLYRKVLADIGGETTTSAAHG